MEHIAFLGEGVDVAAGAVPPELGAGARALLTGFSGRLLVGHQSRHEAGSGEVLGGLLQESDLVEGGIGLGAAGAPALVILYGVRIVAGRLVSAVEEPGCRRILRRLDGGFCDGSDARADLLRPGSLLQVHLQTQSITDALRPSAHGADVRSGNASLKALGRELLVGRCVEDHPALLQPGEIRRAERALHEAGDAMASEIAQFGHHLGIAHRAPAPGVSIE